MKSSDYFNFINVDNNKHTKTTCYDFLSKAEPTATESKWSTTVPGIAILRSDYNSHITGQNGLFALMVEIFRFYMFRKHGKCKSLWLEGWIFSFIFTVNEDSGQPYAYA